MNEGLPVRPGGPTVRRMHREREEVSGWPNAGRSAYWTRRLQRRLAARPPETAPGTRGGPAQPTPEAGPPLGRRSARRGDFPLSIAALLDLRRHPDILVLEGELGIPDPQVKRPGDVAVTWHRSGRRQVRFGGTLEERLLEEARLRLPRLRTWARAADGHSPYRHLDGGSLRPRRGPVHVVERLVLERLIPRLKALGHPRAIDTSAPRPEEFLAGALDSLGRGFALSGGRWHELIPFYGRSPEGRFALEIRGRQFLGLRCMGEAAALKRCELALEEAVLGAFPGAQSGPSPWDLYRDEVYAVVCTPAGRYYVCQRIPPYVVEDMDGTLYYFEGVEIGIQLTSTSPAKVLRPVCVQLMQEYRHMFVGHIGGAAYVCMPRPSSYFDEVHSLEFTEGLLRHLEAARMTLCAGYTPDSAPWHPLNSLGRRALTAAEAGRRGLPVYWFPRPGDKAAARGSRRRRRGR